MNPENVMYETAEALHKFIVYAIVALIIFEVTYLAGFPTFIGSMIAAILILHKPNYRGKKTEERNAQ